MVGIQDTLPNVYATNIFTAAKIHTQLGTLYGLLLFDAVKL